MQIFDRKFVLLNEIAHLLNKKPLTHRINGFNSTK